MNIHRTNTVIALSRNLRDRVARKRQFSFKDKAQHALVTERFRLGMMKVAKARNKLAEAERLFAKGRFEQAFLAADQVEGIINARHEELVSVIRLAQGLGWLLLNYGHDSALSLYRAGDYDGAFEAIQREISDQVGSKLKSARLKLGKKKIGRAQSLLEGVQHFFDIGDYERVESILPKIYTAIRTNLELADSQLFYLRKELEGNGLPGDILLAKAMRLLTDEDYDGFFEETVCISTKIKYFIVPYEELAPEEREDYLRLLVSFSHKRTVEQLTYQQVIDATFAMLRSPETIARIEAAEKVQLPEEPDQCELCVEFPKVIDLGPDHFP